jgi:ERCC4-type nuclease
MRRLIYPPRHLPKPTLNFGVHALGVTFAFTCSSKQIRQRKSGLPMSSLYVDYREGSHDLVAPLTALGLMVEEVTLDSGDVSFIGRGEGDAPVHVGVEFKKLAEAVSSMRSGRLQGEQAPAMMRAYDFRYLLIEGHPTWNSRGLLTRRKSAREFAPMHGHMTIAEYQKRLFTMHIMTGLTPLSTGTRHETLRLIESLYRTWTDKSLTEHHSHIAIYRAPSLAPVSDFCRIVTGLPGIGYELARRLEKTFKTPMAFLTATDTDWRGVEGIGPETCKKIRTCLTSSS